MTQNAAFKRAVRDRMKQTGQTYQQARRALLAERNDRVAVADPPDVAAFTPAWGGKVAGRVTMGNSPRSEREFASALDAFGPVSELLTAKCGEDLVLKSGLAPAQFALRDGMIELSNCLLANNRSQWLIVQGPNCGYSGEGPRKTVELLERLGAPSSAKDTTVVGGVTIVGLRPPRQARDPEWLELGEKTAFEQYVMAREGGGNTVRHWCDEILCAEERPCGRQGLLACAAIAATRPPRVSMLVSAGGSSGRRS